MQCPPSLLDTGQLSIWGHYFHAVRDENEADQLGMSHPMDPGPKLPGHRQWGRDARRSNVFAPPRGWTSGVLLKQRQALAESLLPGKLAQGLPDDRSLSLMVPLSLSYPFIHSKHTACLLHVGNCFLIRKIVTITHQKSLL